MEDWKLFYHDDSDALFWDREWPNDGQCDDVTDNMKYIWKAVERGIPDPRSQIIHALPPGDEIKLSGTASAMVKSYENWERKPSDFYPTPVDATESLVPALQSLGVKRVWEPACGDGRLSRVLEWHGMEVTSTDIREHSGYGYGGLDFLTETPMSKWGWDVEPFDAIITNPPFKLSVQFIERARSLAPVVVMMLKSNYWHAVRRSTLFDNHRPKIVLPLTWRPAFLEKERGKSPLMDVLWCVWCSNDTTDDGKMCVFEPLRKRVYPGYADVGLLSAMDILEGELAALSDTIRG